MDTGPLRQPLRRARVHVEPVQGAPSLEALFAVTAREPGAFLLESAWRPHRFSRWSFLGARPRKVLSARGSRLRLREDGRSRSWSENPFSALRRVLRMEPALLPSAEVADWGIPFLGGPRAGSLARNPSPLTRLTSRLG